MMTRPGRRAQGSPGGYSQKNEGEGVRIPWGRLARIPFNTLRGTALSLCSDAPTGQTIDFRLSAKRDKAAARRFFRRALAHENTRRS